MADLSAHVVLGYGRTIIMPPNPALIVNLPGEIARLGYAVTRAMTLQATPTEALRVIANTVTALRNAGFVAFVASPDHNTTVTSYTARSRVSGSGTITTTQALGKPTPDGNGVIVADLVTTLSALAAGDYTVSILTTSAGGSTDSAESNAITVPLAT
jgi:hypothetical protein